MIQESLISIFGILGFVLLLYAVILLIKRRQYESSRIVNGYNALLFGLFSLALVSLIKGTKYFYFILSKVDEVHLVYFDVVSILILLPLVAGSFLVSMLLFRSV